MEALRIRAAAKLKLAGHAPSVLCSSTMHIAEFRGALVCLMERKHHWAWPLFSAGEVAAERLHIHFEQEFATYVRDFAILIGRAYVQCPTASIRAELAESLYEAETGKPSGGKAHAELFLRFPAGLGMDLDRFETITMLHEAARFRAYVDESTLECGWETAMVIAAIFLGDELYERSSIDPAASEQSEASLDEHPLAKHYSLDVSVLAKLQAHRGVERARRSVAWGLLESIDPAAYPQVLASMEEILGRWLVYRDAVARACGLIRPVAS